MLWLSLYAGKGAFMKYILSLTALPPLFLLWYVYHIDKIEHEPAKLIFKLFIFGVLSCIPAGQLETSAGAFLPYFFEDTMSFSSLFVEYFFIVALAEEGLKYLFMYQLTWRDKEFNYRFDGIVYAVAVSVGFAFFENFLYVFSDIDFAMSIAVQRALTAIPLHTICAIFMGHFYGEARYAYSRYRNRDCIVKLILALVVPLLIHGFYDFCLSTENAVMIIIYFIYVIIIDVLAFIKVRRYAKEDVAV